MNQFIQSSLFLFILLNPFLMSVFLMGLMDEFPHKTFFRVVLRASLISGAIFAAFAVGGESIFVDVFRVRFESFQVFGGVIFLVVGVRMVFGGTDALRELRGPPEHIAGSIAMPFMIGPGTVSASVLAGTRLDPLLAVLSVFVALVATLAGLMVLKLIHDEVKRTRRHLIERYVEIVGRISALFVGSVAVEMLMQGAFEWLGR